jgi:hypothetical protein
MMQGKQKIYSRSRVQLTFAGRESAGLATYMSALGHPPSDRFPQTYGTLESLFFLFLAFTQLTLFVGVVMRILTLG